MGTKVAARFQAGWNRSSLIVALVLLKEGYSAAEAVNLIRDRRSPNALCNPHFAAFIEAQAKASQLERASG
jgi:protein-tyrosine phosphatase